MYITTQAKFAQYLTSGYNMADDKQTAYHKYSKQTCVTEAFTEAMSCTPKHPCIISNCFLLASEPHQSKPLSGSRKRLTSL